MTVPATTSDHPTDEFAAIAEILGRAERDLLERAVAATRDDAWPAVSAFLGATDLIDRARRIARHQDFDEKDRPGHPGGAAEPLDPPGTGDPGVDPPPSGQPLDAVAEALGHLAEATERLGRRLPGLDAVGAIRVARAITLLARARRALEPEDLPGQAAG